MEGAKTTSDYSSDESNFAKDLRTFRHLKQVTQAELAAKILVPQSSIARWESGRTLPSSNVIYKIAMALELTDGETEYLIRTAKRESNTGTRRANKSPEIINSQNLTAQILPAAYSDQIRGLQVQFKDVENAIDELSKRLEQSQSQNDQTITVAEEVESLKQNFAELQATSEALTVPIRIPSRERMQVHLVPSTLLERLEEYRSDESMWLVWFGIFVGSIIGVFVNVATGGQMKNEAWLLIGVFIVMSGLTGGFAYKAKMRGSKLKHELLSSDTPNQDVG
jgi:transcriptional regulator with XRE-family HTH domain